MKLYFLIIFIGLIVFVPNFVDARPPPRDLDWPAREYFTMDNYPGLDGEKEYWQQYYDFKGKIVKTITKIDFKLNICYALLKLIKK